MLPLILLIHHHHLLLGRYWRRGGSFQFRPRHSNRSTCLNLLNNSRPNKPVYVQHRMLSHSQTPTTLNNNNHRNSYWKKRKKNPIQTTKRSTFFISSKKTHNGKGGKLKSCPLIRLIKKKCIIKTIKLQKRVEMQENLKNKKEKGREIQTWEGDWRGIMGMGNGNRNFREIECLHKIKRKEKKKW